MSTPAHERFGERLSAAESFDAALDLLACAVVELGFDGVDYACLASTSAIAGDWAKQQIYSRNFPARWERGWRVYGQHDPILPWTYRKGLPVDWAEIKQQDALTQPQRDSIAYLEFDMGFPAGITVPIFLPNNRFAFVSGVSAHTGEAWSELRSRAMGPLMTLAHTFHHVTARYFPHLSAVPVHLSPREIQCLYYAAAGYTAPATARRINRTVDTARRHLKSAMAKLDAKTIAQAVSIAITMGAFDPGATPVGPTEPGVRPP